MNKLSDKLLLIKNKYKHLVSFLNDVKKDKVLIDEIEKATLYLPNDCKLSQRIFDIIANKTNLTLRKECSNTVKFLDLTRGYSIFCSARCSANSKETRKKIKETRFKIYGYFSPRENNEIKEKQIKTMIERYGVDNISKLDSIKEKKKQTRLMNYGTNNIFELEKTKQTMIERYGVNHSSYNLETIKKRKQTMVENHTLERTQKFSKMSQELFWAIYDNLDTELRDKTYFSELNFEFNKQFKENLYSYDFVISKIKYCIEFNGDFWHSNPDLYEENHIHQVIGKNAKQIWEKDELKINSLKELGFEIDVIWENEYKRNKKEIINKITNKIQNLWETYKNKK